jgi:hypothetical protein
MVGGSNDMKTKDCNLEFNKIAKEFFPEWDRQGWTAVFQTEQELTVDGISLQGGCDPWSKTIGIFDWWTDPDWIDRETGKPVPKDEHIDYLDTNLIHEICHAILVTRGKTGAAMSHNYHWFELMQRAVDHAKSIGRIFLATKLEKNIQKWRKLVSDIDTEQIKASTCFWKRLEREGFIKKGG